MFLKPTITLILLDFVTLMYLAGERQRSYIGAYAASNPKWIAAMIKGDDVYINGDGETSRDFCYIDNVVQANILAALAIIDNYEDEKNFNAINQIYNVAVGDKTSLNELYYILNDTLSKFDYLKNSNRYIENFGKLMCLRHSQANIKAQLKLGYEPSHRVKDSLIEAMDWYIEKI